MAGQSSLGYAERLSYREDLGGQLGAPELHQEAATVVSGVKHLADLVSSQLQLVCMTKVQHRKPSCMQITPIETLSKWTMGYKYPATDICNVSRCAMLPPSLPSLVLASQLLVAFQVSVLLGVTAMYIALPILCVH